MHCSPLPSGVYLYNLINTLTAKTLRFFFIKYYFKLICDTAQFYKIIFQAYYKCELDISLFIQEQSNLHALNYTFWTFIDTYPTKANYLYNKWTSLQHCTNVIQMVCIYWIHGNTY